MAQVTWDGGSAYEMVLKAHTDAPPAAVFSRLTDLSAHLDWGGRRQRRNFRLTAMHAATAVPDGARAGTEFVSEGVIR